MTAPRTTTRQPVQLAALIAGIVFLVVGIAGFIPGLTTNCDQLGAAGHGSMALLLRLFQGSVLHNIVHLPFGVAGLALARTPAGARTYLIYGGIIYAVLWIYGLVIDMGGPANVVPLNTADNWLHLVLAVGMIALGAALRRNRARA